MTTSLINKRYLDHNGDHHCSIARIIFLFLGLLFSTPLIAADKQKNVYEDDELYLRYIYPFAEGIAAFYEGRGFPKSAIERVTQTCYVTFVVKNKSDDILWFELDNWLFHKNGETIQRYKQSYWDKQWDEIKLKQAYRSTFSWTLFPEVRDARPGESVSGNIALPVQTQPFSLTLNFARGENKNGKMKSVKINDIICRDAVQK